ncbi:MAG: FeoB-associated Cys-rich membrane protein [Oscillospiraceae bacterium]|nr:FeoB-associated Cys-rich membrane protein [Oscillospiraceae bacterium]
MNIPTIVTVIIIIALFVCAIVYIIKSKKENKNSCSGNCSCCPLNCSKTVPKEDKK